MDAIQMVRDAIGNPKDKCYMASEAVLVLTGGKDSPWRPHVIRKEHMWPDGRISHWYLVHRDTGEILDLTAHQFPIDFEIPYDQGRPNGMMFHPAGGSKRTKQFIRKMETKDD